MRADRPSHCAMPRSTASGPVRLQRSARSALQLALLAGLLAGCSVGPDYKRPAVAVPAQFKEAAPGWKTAQPNDQNNRGPWWEVFNDAQLNALEARVAVANQTVACFEASYRQARALGSEASAAYFPTLGLSARNTRSKSSTAFSSSNN